MRILITGANGFIGKNLQRHLSELKNIKIFTFTREDNISLLPKLVKNVDFVFHLAGVNRPKNESEFLPVNAQLTEILCDLIANEIKLTKRKIGLVFTSSIQADSGTLYGLSKKKAEESVIKLGELKNALVFIFRLPNLFGKWSRPNYNSVVATFCYNIAHQLPLVINNPDDQIMFVYIDDLVECFLGLLNNPSAKNFSNFGIQQEKSRFFSVKTSYLVTLREVTSLIKSFKNSRKTHLTERVGQGFCRALYATYISYLPVHSCAYKLSPHRDARGSFIEFIKTPDCGQISVFTTAPGCIRGSHYHHSKTEKFLVIKGKSKFSFTNINGGETHELFVSDKQLEVIETIPGWAHEIENIGNDEMIVILWSNEIYNIDKPDTYSYSMVT